MSVLSSDTVLGTFFATPTSAVTSAGSAEKEGALNLTLRCVGVFNCVVRGVLLYAAALRSTRGCECCVI